MTELLIDYHGHLYPSYDLDTALDSALHNLSLNSSTTNPTKALVLCERFDCNVFLELEQRADKLLDRWQFDSLVKNASARLSNQSGEELFLFAGRQIVTSERLELLCLGVNAKIPEGITFEQGFNKVLEAGGYPVLNWALGKWMFKRREIVENILDNADPNILLIGDTSLRPALTPEPKLMATATKQGFVVVAGSDPLPFIAEQCLLGTYGMQIEIEDNFTPSELLKHSIDSSKRKTIGRRSSIPSVLKRNYELRKQKKYANS